MKIAVTGYSAPQTGSKRSPIQRHSVPLDVVTWLRENTEHEVTWGVYHENARLVQRADLLIVFLAPPHNLLARNAIRAMLNAYDRWDAPVLWFLDDWQVKQIETGHRTVGNHTLVRVNRIVGGAPLYPGDKDVQRARHKDVHDVCRVLDGANEWPERWHLVAPLDRWGIHERLRDVLPKRWPWSRFHALDVSPLLPRWDFTPIPLADRQRRWACPTLLNRPRWQKMLARLAPTWPVDEAGYRRSGNRFKTESEVQTFVAARWGVMSPTYDYANGCGWFRSRFYTAARTGTVVWADAAEVEGLPGYHVPLAEVEAADDRELKYHALRQDEILYANSSTRDEFDTTFTRVLEEVTS